MNQEKWSATLEEKCRLANDLYLSLCTALQLSTLRGHGQDNLATLMWRMLRHHQRTHFLPGLKKLGLEHEATDAIKAGKYHYFSNLLGGLDVEYVEESPEKVWIRYPSPYVMSDSPFSPSVSVAAYSARVGQATYSAWHAYNGVSLCNPRMGFVLTHLIQQGDSHNGGYFKIFHRNLAPDETLQFSPGEQGPPFDPATAPRLPVEDWNEVRKARAMRNYVVEYVNSTTAILLEMYGANGAATIAEHASRVTMAQLHRKVLQGLQIADFSAGGIATFIQRDRDLLHEAVEMEEISGGRWTVRQRSRNPRLYPDPHLVPVDIDRAFLQGWRVLVELANPDLTIDMTSALSAGDSYYEWVIGPRRLYIHKS